MKTCPACNHQNLGDALICESCGDRMEVSSGMEKTKIRDAEMEAFAARSLLASRYEVVREIGRGGMGVVYRVHDTRLQSREMALKMIHPQLVELPEAQQRFEQEVNTCLDLLHPNIVRVHNLEEWQGLQFFTMEYITGLSLQELIAERKSQKPPFTLSEAASIITPLLDALAYAHQFTIHRDIKPDNIIVTGDFPNISVKVLDFGIAKTLSASRFTQTAQVMGTAFYMAPEQMSGGDIDHRADLYSTGMIFYEMLTGKMAVGRFRLPGELYTGMPKEIDELLEKALAPSPEQRFPDATAMQQALQKAVSISEAEIKVKPLVETPEATTPAEKEFQQIQQESGTAKPVPAGIQRKFLPWMYASAAILVVVLAACVFFLSRNKKISVTTVPTTQKDQIRPKTEIKKETAVKESTPPDSGKSKPVEAVSRIEKDWSNDWSVVQELAGYTLNNGPYESCPASYKGFRVADTISGPIVIHISDQVKRPDWIRKGKFAEYSGSTNWRWTVKDALKSSVQVIDVLGGGFPKAIGKKEIKPSFAVTLIFDPHYPNMQSIDDWFVFPFIIRAYHFQLIENLTENFVKQKVDTPLGSIECYQLQYPEREPDTGKLELYTEKGGGGMKIILGSRKKSDHNVEIDDGKHAARSISRYLALQVSRSPKPVIRLWYDMNTGVLVKGITQKGKEESISFVLKDTNIKGLALR